MQSQPDHAGFDPTRLQRLEDHLRDSYVAPGKIAGCQLAIVRPDTEVYQLSLGSMDRERDRPVADDTIWRWYSMTKPITGVALLSLYEQGRFRLTDPVHRFLPEFADTKVSVPDGNGGYRLVDQDPPMTVRDAMMHMTGIGYGPRGARLDISQIGRSGPNRGMGTGATLATLMETLAQEPLRFQPGSHWLYSWSTDVCARLVEVISGQAFDDYLRTTVFEPLGMVDTGFHVAEAAHDRLAALYGRDADKRLTLIDDPTTSRSLRPVTLLSGGGGLLGTTADYVRFCRMLLNRGQLDGNRILGPKTIELMTSNHLPDGTDLAHVAAPGSYGEVGFEGMGFGLTVAVSGGPVATAASGSAGEYMWGGAASTIFWIDPSEDLAVVFMAQLLPSGTFDFRSQLKALVYGALTGAPISALARS